MANASTRIIIEEGISYAYDVSREKFLSISRTFFRGSVNSASCFNQVLRSEDGITQSTSPFVSQKRGTICGLDTQSKTDLTLVIFVNEVEHEFSCGKYSFKSLNIDLNPGDKIKLFAKGKVEYPMVSIEIAWRL